MITDPDSGWTEATITINGRTLSFGEACALRMAVSTYLMFLAGPEVAREMGPIGQNYTRHLHTIARAFEGHVE